MTNPPPEQPSAEQEDPRPDEPAASEHVVAQDEPAGAPQPAADPDAEDPTDRRSRKGLLIGLGAGGVAVVALALAALVWPGFLAGPGTPDRTAEAAVSALAAKNPGELDAVTCRTPDGRPTAQLPPEALQLIQRIEQTGPPTLLLDTQASAPVDLTLSGQGRTETVPADLLLAVTNDEWCLNGVAPRA